MRWLRSLELVQVHCQGEIGKVIVGGAPEIPGATMLDKMNHINHVDGSLRRFVTHEPRACAQMSVNLLIAPTRPDADAGFIVLQIGSRPCDVRQQLHVRGDGFARDRPRSDAGAGDHRPPGYPAGLVVARARCEDGRCVQVSLDNVAAFVEELDKTIETERWGRIKADIAFGGIYLRHRRCGSAGHRDRPEERAHAGRSRHRAQGRCWRSR